ncbi:7-carboxy-7-deazaguanine synthase QueE [Curtobacterium sp. RRHDQ66]|uniref:7-carboxy-7-deazaguanine synthase QueE n=1 Tax=Curtobacterium guangdongense TaxID=3413380 RepID=UPI003BF01A88
MRDRLHISEIFTSLQGEGPSLGEYAVFLRLGRCNLSCSWCDTAYSWDWTRFNEAEEITLMPISDVVAHVLAINPRPSLLVVSGGEPLLQQPALTRLLVTLNEAAPDLRVEFETNGTIRPSPMLAAQANRFVVSPKLSNSNVPLERRIRPETLRTFATADANAFKFVVSNVEDVSEVVALSREVGFSRNRVWLMPEGATERQQQRSMRLLADAAIKEGFNFTPRLQVILWGDERGT